MRRTHHAYVGLPARIASLLLSSAWMICASLPSPAAVKLGIDRTDDGRSTRLSAEASSNQVVIVESTSDLGSWEELLRAHGSFHDIADVTAGQAPSAFYRALARDRTDTDDWKNVVHGGSEDPFQSQPDPPWNPAPRWIKFTIVLDEPHRVYFQDSTEFPFHYDFAVERLPQFKGMNRAEFDAVTLRTQGQTAVLGAVLFPASTNLQELAIQFVGYDPYPREAIAEWFHTVRAMIMAPPGTHAFYLPTFEQANVARQNEKWFEDQGIPIGSAGRWVIGDECYAPGWALGRLVFVPATEIHQAYRDGRLGPTDVLLTDAVPAEVPPLAGIISLSPATPNSHVALLARSFGIPFVYLARPDAEELLRSWDGRDVTLRAFQQFLGCEVTVAELATPLDPAMREEILAFKVPPELNITPKETSGRLSLEVDDLAPADVKWVGGKAANLGVLRRSIPTNSPSPVIAFTFDLWDGYLSQTLPGGRTLAQTIEARLGEFTWPPDVNALQTALEEIRTIFTDEADFSADQRAAILAALQAAGFDPQRKIRFRSSTNVEDSEQFSGAGLYDSFSGCLADDLDGDNNGPSICDPAEDKERGVFRALRKVFASFYNDNAFLERLRHRVNEDQVGMAVLVHHSTPDDIELANGVATLRISGAPGEQIVDGELVSQVGAVSVSNPDNSARPEVVSAFQIIDMEPSFEVRERSSLVPLGGNVLSWPDEYRLLYRLLRTASLQWQEELPRRDQWILDFEYKKVAPDGDLRIKQIRPLPLPPEEQAVTPWLVNTTNLWGVDQGEFGNLFSLHRLKSFWVTQTRNTRLNDPGLESTLFTRIDARLLEGTNEVTLGALITNLPGHEYRRQGNMVTDSWDSPAGERFLRLNLERFAPPNSGPVAILEDFRLEFGTRYSEPQPLPEFIFGGRITNHTTLEDVAFLRPITPVSLESILQERTWSRGPYTVQTKFYWPPPPKGAVAGYTAPLQAWVETVLTGFTSTPIVLRGEYSQTYRPGHHNFWEEFLFDPWLEPGVDPAILAELTAANIRGIIITWDRSELSNLAAWGLDNSFRELK